MNSLSYQYQNVDAINLFFSYQQQTIFWWYQSLWKYFPKEIPPTLLLCPPLFLSEWTYFWNFRKETPISFLFHSLYCWSHSALFRTILSNQEYLPCLYLSISSPVDLRAVTITGLKYMYMDHFYYTWRF